MLSTYKTPLQFVVAVRQSDFELFAISDLDNKLVCTEHALSPSALSLTLAAETHQINPRRAVTWSVQDKMLKDDPRCRAFVINNALIDAISSANGIVYER